MTTELDDARYINLLSYKRDGGEARTPVWAAKLDGAFVIYTKSDSYKVKRIRRNAKVRVAKCNARGVLLGAWHDAVCVIIDDKVRQQQIMRALTAKYGLQIRALNFFARITGRDKRRAYLEVTLGR